MKINQKTDKESELCKYGFGSLYSYAPLHLANIICINLQEKYVDKYKIISLYSEKSNREIPTFKE